MKTQILSVAFLAAIALTGCNSNSSKDNLLNDAKRAAELECKNKEVMQAFTKGNISTLDEATRLSDELFLIKKKYQGNDQLYSEFLEAMDKGMANCEVEETESFTEIMEENNEDWDKMLDDYEAYIDEYAKLYKKALNGDNSAFSAYPELLEKAENLQKSLQKAEQSKKLGAAQLKRMAKIQAKMIEAL